MIQFEYETSRDRIARWCHLSTIPGTTPHYTEGNINILGTRSLESIENIAQSAWFSSFIFQT